VELLAARHVVAGMGDGRFEPERGVTRAEVASMVVEVLAHDPARTVERVATTQPTFSGVPADCWFYT